VSATRSHIDGVVDSEAPLVAIVDDEESIRTALLRLFRGTRFRSIAFASAMDFLNYAENGMPDCLVLDMRLPGMTGIELLRRLSHFENRPPVIVITGDIEQRTKDECIARGILHYLSKPFDGRLLLDSVSNVVGVPPY